MLFSLRLWMAVASLWGAAAPFTQTPSFAPAEQCPAVLKGVSRGMHSAEAPRRPDLPLDISEKLEQRLAAVWHDPFNPAALELTREKPEEKYGGDVEQTRKLKYNGALVADFDVRMRDDTMRFDIKVVEEYRKADLYEALLARALRDFPETRSIPARFPYERSDNLKALVKRVFETPEAFQNASVKPLDAAGVAAFRAKVLAAVYEMPAFKARERNGFARLRTVMLIPGKMELGMIVDKGERLPDGEIAISIDEGVHPTLLNFDGSTQTMVGHGRSLGKYVEEP